MPPACAGRAQGTRAQPEQPALTDVAAPNRGITHTCTHLPPAGARGPLRTPAHTYHLQDPGTPAYTCTHTTCTSQWTPAHTCTHTTCTSLWTLVHTCKYAHTSAATHACTQLHTHLSQPSGLCAPPCPVSLAILTCHSTFCFELVACFLKLLPQPSAPSGPCSTRRGWAAACPTHRVATGATRSSEKSLREMLVTWQATPWPHTGTGLTPVLAIARMHWPGRDSQPQVTRLAGSQGTS